MIQQTYVMKNTAKAATSKRECYYEEMYLTKRID